MSLTSRWRLNRGLSTSQDNFLKAMGRPKWQVWAIDKTEEDFRLFHFVKVVNGHNVHVLEKKVQIRLNMPSMVKKVAKTVGVEFEMVNYKHQLTADGVRVSHEDDEKGFGKCQSSTVMGNGDKAFVIEWFLKNGTLRVTHCVNSDDRFVVKMTYTDKKGVSTSATKRYDRIAFNAADNKDIERHNLKAHIRRT